MRGRLLAVDPSLTCTGWAILTVERGEILGVGKLRSLPPQYPLELRLKKLQEKVTTIFDELGLTEGDFLVCEAPTTMRDPKAAFKVERVRGIFETVARARNVSIPGRINPRTVQQEVMGLRGKQLKRELVKLAAQRTVHALYKKPLERIGFPTEEKALKQNQDIVDALLIGAASLVYIQNAFRAGNSFEALFDRLVK